MKELLTLPTLPGTYALIMQVEKLAIVQVGALGHVHIPDGWLVYVGSAFGPGGLRGRLRHHLRPVVKAHWHIDYLRDFVSLLEVWYSESPTRLEHLWADALEITPEAFIPMKGFGSSDCRCKAHLFHFAEQPGEALLGNLDQDIIIACRRW
ncbi:MAG: GIY-YIG nuclease family protein [Chloroflexi bacterium]|nr:GIY-YIG nuclease family protein [Chloroflexota bacterium]